MHDKQPHGRASLPSLLQHSAPARHLISAGPACGGACRGGGLQPCGAVRRRAAPAPAQQLLPFRARSRHRRRTAGGPRRSTQWSVWQLNILSVLQAVLSSARSCKQLLPYATGMHNSTSTHTSPVDATGRVGSLPLRARGRLLEQRSPSAAGADPWAASAAAAGGGGGGGAPNSSKGRIALHHVRDWVVDHTQPAPAIWLVTSAAWYRWALLLCHGQPCFAWCGGCGFVTRLAVWLLNSSAELGKQ